MTHSSARNLEQPMQDGETQVQGTQTLPVRMKNAPNNTEDKQQEQETKHCQQLPNRLKEGARPDSVKMSGDPHSSQPRHSQSEDSPDEVSEPEDDTASDYENEENDSSIPRKNGSGYLSGQSGHKGISSPNGHAPPSFKPTHKVISFYAH